MIRFSIHANQRLSERNISQDKVAATIALPDHLASSRLGRMEALRLFDKLYLKVIFVKEKDDIMVLTAYWTRRPKNKGN